MATTPYKNIIKPITTMKIAVFCSANAHIDSDYFRLTEEMGKWMAEHGHDLVFGFCWLSR